MIPNDFQAVYDSIRDEAKNPDLCRRMWDSAQAALRAELEAQEPVAVCDQNAIGRVLWIKYPGGTGVSLYARPIPPTPAVDTLDSAIEQSAERLPDGWKTVITVERGAAWVHLETPMFNTIHIDGADKKLAEQMSDALASAIGYAK